jgi:hypothetical protein
VTDYHGRPEFHCRWLGGTKKRRWDSRNPGPQKSYTYHLLLEAKNTTPSQALLPMNALPSPGRSSLAGHTAQISPLFPHHVSRIVIKEHAKRSSDDAISQLPAMFLEPCSQMLPPNPHGPDPTGFFLGLRVPTLPRLPTRCKGRHGPTLGNCLWDSIDAMMLLLCIYQI